MSGDGDRDRLLGRVIPAIAGWTVLITQLNGIIAARMGVTQSDLQCLYVLAQHGPSTAATLARHVNLTSGSASRMIDRLHAAGYVRRSPDPHDRRRVLIEPTPESIERVASFYRPLNERLAEHLEPFDAEALQRLLEFLQAAESSTETVIRNA